MKNKNDLIIQQKPFIEKMRTATRNLIAQWDKSEIETILLSGSVARGDFFPGKFGGMVDLIVMVKDEKSFDAEKVFGTDENKVIPYHCISFTFEGEKIEFAIDIRPFITAEYFETQWEPRKFSFLEGIIYYDESGRYEKELEKINELKERELKKYFSDSLGYIYHLISDYKKDKFFRRGAYIQMHENLNVAIHAALKCLYYINNLYQCAEERSIFYSLHFKKLPENYELLLHDLMQQDVSSYEDYERREKLFREKFLSFLEENKI